MASEEHKKLAAIIKEVHASLRRSSLKLGADEAWQEHCRNKDKLVVYAESMQKLATTYWEDNSASKQSETKSRINWTAELAHTYFIEKLYLKYRSREFEIAKKLNISIPVVEDFSVPVKLMDVGSCYNPFKKYDYFNVLAIDLCPANTSVYECDFLEVESGPSFKKNANKIEQLPCDYFDMVTFCFLLEYIPNSPLRIKACIKAYDILRPGGLLVINTPDSKHVGANSKLMKNWRYTLACMGFSRIKYEKFKHMHCMAFRKSLSKDVAVRWASIHKVSDMEYILHIPQDFNSDSEEKHAFPAGIVDMADFKELPFNDME